MLLAFLFVSVVLRAQTDTIGATKPLQYAEMPDAADTSYHSPHKAAMYSAILPGLGQAYNKKYWKLPILYAGVGAVLYGLNFNNKYYNLYKNAYRDFIVQDPANKSYAQFAFQVGISIEEAETTRARYFGDALRNKKTYYKRNRDLCIIGLAGIYVLSLIDASVDAHFFDFDVSDDLSIKIIPEVTPPMDLHDRTKPTLGMNLSITF
jgi:hypothetical protein